MLAMLRLAAASAALAACVASGPAFAQSAPAADWVTLGRVLAVVQSVMQAAASDDPLAGQRAIDELMSGRNAEANALLLDIMGEVPASERERMLSIGRSIVSMNRKQIAAQSREGADAAAIQARKDLTGMGLAYYDVAQYLDAVRRSDLIAARLFILGRGVDVGARDASGASALDIARRAGNAEMMALLGAAAPR
jgi:hypothetical protein